MKRKTRLHVQLESGDQKEWLFDDPDVVTIGHDQAASIWLEEAVAGPAKPIFVRRGGYIEFRIDRDLKGTLFIGNQKVPIADLSEAGLIKRDRRGEYVLLRDKTAGTVEIGKSAFRFWISRPPKELEYPRHFRTYDLIRNAPWQFVGFFLLSACVHALLLNGLQMLPPLVTPSVHEIQQRFAKISIPSADYIRKELRKIDESAQGVGREVAPEPAKGGDGKKAPSKPKGFIPAVAASVGKGSKSPFAQLFTSDTLNMDLAKALSGKSLDEAIKIASAQGAAGASGSELGATKTQMLESGSLRQGDAKRVELAANLSGPKVARLNVDAPQVDGEMSRPELDRLVSTNAGQLRNCYEMALALNPNLSGKITVGLTVQITGLPTGVKIEQTSMPNRALEQCIISRISLWVFPKPTGGATVVKFPVIFAASARG